MSDRRLVYPYSLTAKIASFPYKFYYENSMLFKYSSWALLLMFPVFLKMQSLVCSEGNYAKLAEYKRKELNEIETHKDHLI